MTKNSVLSSLIFNLFLIIQVLISDKVYDGIHGSFRGLKIKWTVYLCVICIDVVLPFMMSEYGTEGKCVHAEFIRAENSLERHHMVSQPCLIEHYSQRCVVSDLIDKSGTFAKLCPSVQCDSPEMKAKWYNLQY